MINKKTVLIISAIIVFTIVSIYICLAVFIPARTLTPDDNLLRKGEEHWFFAEKNQQKRFKIIAEKTGTVIFESTFISSLKNVEMRDVNGKKIEEDGFIAVRKYNKMHPNKPLDINDMLATDRGISFKVKKGETYYLKIVYNDEELEGGDNEKYITYKYIK